MSEVPDAVRAEAEAAARGLPPGVEPSMDLPAGLPAVRVHEIQAREAVASVLTNAVEAVQEVLSRVPGRTHRITVSAALERVDPEREAAGHVPQAVPAAGEYVAVSVADTGPGMDARTLARIFDPFFTTKFMGLGLAAVMGTVLAHRGGLRVASVPRGGSTMTLLFPVSRWC